MARRAKTGGPGPAPARGPKKVSKPQERASPRGASPRSADAKKPTGESEPRPSRRVAAARRDAAVSEGRRTPAGGRDSRASGRPDATARGAEASDRRRAPAKDAESSRPSRRVAAARRDATEPEGRRAPAGGRDSRASGRPGASGGARDARSSARTDSPRRAPAGEWQSNRAEVSRRGEADGRPRRARPEARRQASAGRSGSRGHAVGLEAPERLHRALSRAGVASRREAERLVDEGRISVNGKLAEAGQSVGPGDRVLLDGRPVFLRAPSEGLPVVLRYHKPPGEVCSTVPQGDAPSVYDQLPRGRWVMVGRLDLNTAGLLLFTSDGDLANRLMHPSHSIEREYVVRIRGSLDDANLARLRRGVELEDGPARFDHISPTGSEYRDADRHNRWYRVILREGRNREVRRMFESVDATVSRLVRVRYGAIDLPRSVRPGRHEMLPERDVLALLESVGMGAEPKADEAATEPGRNDKPGRRGATRKVSGKGPAAAGRDAKGKASTAQRAAKGKRPGVRRPAPRGRK